MEKLHRDDLRVVLEAALQHIQSLREDDQRGIVLEAVLRVAQAAGEDVYGAFVEEQLAPLLG
ncbi:hypothetical protein U7230_13900 [Carboxydochorda subterranea]|uniref:Uncharacterized protein n=1 Tax=Carboxydichorda subterranea TaxID=3109565 RepID=A0ABZ1BX97_9FIRM|nr:hypothetical protein [Limnochorda sp. L945t]WRP17161.1 hypothetical protein U7230_13900 [Limnochorda sp. L945t]